MAKPEKAVEIGGVFGEMTVIETGLWASNGTGKARAVRLRCSCGQETIARIYGLPRCKSCRKCSTWSSSHRNSSGDRRSPEYIAWDNMLQRCYNRSNPQFHDYGGRGIAVCQEWRDSFEAFLGSVGARPGAKHSLDRVDNSGDYCPANCRWTTWDVQGRNRRNNHLITLNGRTESLAGWAEILGISRHALYNRVYHGWTTEEILTTPFGARRRH